jgi:hypothetical protein
MIRSFTIPFALAAVAIIGVVGQAKAYSQPGTHLMWMNPYKAAAYTVRHDNATCPNMRLKAGKL